MEPAKPPRLGPPRLAIAAACLFLVGYSLYGIDSPLTWGHHGFHIGENTVRARSTERFHTLTPSMMAGFRGPPSTYWYMHRPPGSHFQLLLTRLVLGESEWSVRASALVMSLMTILALARLARRGWGAWAGAGAACIAVLLPYMAWFSAHFDEGMGGLFGILMSLGSYLAFRERGRWRDALAAMGFLALAGWFEWTAYMLAPALCLHALVAGLLERRHDRARGNRVVAVAFLFGAVLLVEVGLFFLWVWRVGAMRDFVDSFRARNLYHYKPGEYLGVVVAYTGELFTWPGVAVVCAWLAALCGRLVARRARTRDIAPCALLFALGVMCSGMKQYVHTHIYLMKAGFPAVVLCAVALAVDGGHALGWLATRLRGARTRRWPAIASAALVAGGLAASLGKPWWSGLVESRAKGGIPLWPVRYDPDLERNEFARLVHAETAPGDLLIEKSFSRRYEWVYYADRDEERVNDLSGVAAHAAKDKRAVVVFQEPLSSDDDKRLRVFLQRHPAVVAGPFWMVDLRKDKPGIRAYNINASRKKFPTWERFLRYPAFAPRELERNPWHEVDLSVRYGVRAAPDARTSLGVPTDVGRHRQILWHNYQLIHGEPQRAAPARALVLAGYDVASAPVDVTPRTRLAAFKFEPERKLIALLWEARTRAAADEETAILTATPTDAVAAIDGVARKPTIERVLRVPLANAEAGFLAEDEQVLQLSAGRYRLEISARGKNGKPVGPPQILTTIAISEGMTQRLPKPPVAHPGAVK